MSGRPTVSVALCTHNGARYIDEQVRSILAQSEMPAEVVVSDDASSDDTVARIEAAWIGLGHGAPVLRIIRNPVALGVSRNFEQAALACTADLVALCDQDDSWQPHRLATIVAQFTEHPELELLFTDAWLVDAAGERLGMSLFDALEIGQHEVTAVRDGRAFDVLLRRNLVTGATTVFRRSLLAAAVPFSPVWVHDEWLAIIAAARSRVDLLTEQLVEYRQHGANEIGMRVPTLRYKVGRVFEPRADRYSDLLARAVALRARLGELGASAAVLASVDEKVKHQAVRDGLPRNRLARIAPIGREASTGRYALYSSQGALDILRDILQPA